MSLTAIDLFSGCGGLSRGLKDAGFQVLGAVEIDSKARETFNLNHPDVPIVGEDIRLLTSERLLSETGLEMGELDLLAGCPPCQGFSKLRSKNGKRRPSDERNRLIDEFSRIVFGTMPKMVMMENVPALRTYGRFESFVRELKNNHYDVRVEILDVSGFGVPQRRKRLILSASRLGPALLADQQNAPKATVYDAIGSLPAAGASGDPLHDYPPSKRTPRIQELISSIPKDGGSRRSLPDRFKLQCHIDSNGFSDVYGRMAWGDVSPTITSGCSNPSKGRFLHPQEDRPITLREAAILQGFPKDYLFNPAHGKEPIALMIGNALPPPFIRAHAEAMAKGIVA